MSLNSYNAFYQHLMGRELPPPESVRPLVTMEMLQAHFKGIQQVEPDIEKIVKGEQVGFIRPEERIKCISCNEWSAPTTKMEDGRIICEFCNGYANLDQCKIEEVVESLCSETLLGREEKLPQLLRHDN